MIVGPGAINSVRIKQGKHPAQGERGQDRQHVHHADPLVIERQEPSGHGVRAAPRISVWGE